MVDPIPDKLTLISHPSFAADQWISDMAPALELLRAVASDRYKAEGIEASREALDILNKTDGHIAYAFYEFNRPKSYSFLLQLIHRYGGSGPQQVVRHNPYVLLADLHQNTLTH